MRRLCLAIALIWLPSLADSRPQDPPAKPAPKEKEAPPPGPALVLANARIYPVSGPAIDGGSILIENGKIKAVGKTISVPSDAKVIDLAGKVVIPGLIDTGSGLFVQADGGSSGGSAEQDVCDALDFFDDQDRKEALASGVTVVCVSPPNRGSLQGQSAVVRVHPGSTPEARILKRAAALKMSLGVASGETSTASQRYRDYVGLKEAFDGAIKYRESWDKYRKEFEEYEKKKKEWDAKKKAAPKKEDAKTDDAKKEDPKKDDAKKEEPKKEDPKKEEPPKAPEAEPQDPPREGRSRRGGGGGGGGSTEPAAASADGEPKKPSKPRLDPRNEVLVRALDEKNPLTVRVEAHSIDCIELALRLAEDFKLKMVLEQATEGSRAAEAIAKAKVPVAVGPVFRYGLPRVDYLRHSLDTASHLVQAGVEISIGSFPAGSAGHRGAGAGRFLMEAAAWASSRGLTREQALQAVTLNPAKQLGLADQIGSIAENRIADLVVLSGEIFEAGTTVERTLSAGEEVWTAPEAPAPAPAAAAATPAKAKEGAEAPAKAAPKGDMVLLRGARIVPVVGTELPDGAVLLAGGKIHSIAAKIDPPEGATVVDLPKGSVVVPGFIDMHTHLAASFEADETTETVTPLVRAVEAFASTNPDARAAARSGVTLAALSPGNANLIGGRPGLVRLNGERLDRMVWKDAYGLKVSLGREPLRRDAEPTSRAGAVRMLREILADKGSETWKILVEKKEPALVHARQADDIVRLAEAKLTSGIRAVLIHGNEALQAIDAIKVSGLGVAFGPLTVSDSAEILSTPARLVQAGIPLALITDAPAAGEDHLRVMAVLAVRHGLSPEDALRALTIVPATLLGIGEEFGSLEPGKQGDVVVYSGDPLSLASDIEMVVIEGRIIHRKSKKDSK